MIIAIGGVSRAGKSTLASLIKQAFEKLDQSVTIIEQDKYAYAEEKIPKIKDKIDWESPASIDFKSFSKAIKTAKKEYDHVIAEGLLVFYDSPLSKLYDKSIFIKIPKKPFLERKELDLRWSNQPEPKWYIEHIWKSYKTYGTENIPKDLIKLSGELSFDLEVIMDELLDRTAERKLFEEIVDILSSKHKSVERGPMMSAPGVRYKKKNFAFFHNNEMTFKLGKNFDAQSYGIKSIKYLSPFKIKAPMKSWYIISSNQKNLWKELADLALENIQQELG